MVGGWRPAERREASESSAPSSRSPSSFSKLKTDWPFISVFTYQLYSSLPRVNIVDKLFGFYWCRRRPFSAWVMSSRAWSLRMPSSLASSSASNCLHALGGLK